MISLGCLARMTVFMILTGVGIYVMNWLSELSRSFKKFRLVGLVSEIHCYPVAAFSGIVGSQALCTVNGLQMSWALDKQYLVGRPIDSTFAARSPVGTIKQFYSSKMRTIKAECNSSHLVLTTNKEHCKVDLAQDERRSRFIQLHRASNISNVIDLGDEVANWLDENLQAFKLRMYKVISDIAIVTPGRDTRGNYSFAVLDSINYINKMIKIEPRLTAMYFRPNIVLSGNTPLDETKWSYIKINNVYFEVSCSDSRIFATKNNIPHNIDWKPTWEFPPEMPQDILVLDGYSFTADLGVNAKALTEGEINVGDPVFAAY